MWICWHEILNIDKVLMKKRKKIVILWYNSVGEYLSVVLLCLSVHLVQEHLVDLLLTGP